MRYTGVVFGFVLMAASGYAEAGVEAGVPNARSVRVGVEAGVQERVEDGGALYARTSSESNAIDTLIPGNWLGAPQSRSRMQCFCSRLVWAAKAGSENRPPQLINEKAPAPAANP